jgi:hypothetical protein
MNRNTQLWVWAMILVVVVPALVGVVYWLWWDLYQKYQPNLIKRNQEEIQLLLDRAGYVSPKLAGAPLYVITHRDCKPCRAFEGNELPKYQSIGIDTRVIVIAPADDQGLAQSTPAERSTVAELWWSHDWALYQKWYQTPDNLWKADGLVVADNDLARTAVVGAGRDFMTKLSAALSQNGVRVSYPLVIWRDKANRLKVCACADPKSFEAVRVDLGAPASIAPHKPLFDLKGLNLPEIDWSKFKLPEWTKAKPKTADSVAKPAAAEVRLDEADAAFAAEASAYPASDYGPE